jgi:hypothetical protein
MPSRRAFLGLLAGAALDPERLLWRPGAKLISIPPAPAPPFLLSPEIFERLTLEALEGKLMFHGNAMFIEYPRIGDTVNVRVPQRFVARVGVAHGRGRLKA